MKKIILFLLMVSVALSACIKDNTVVISGKITNSTEENVLISDNSSRQIDTAKINPETSTFLIETEPEKEYLATLYTGGVSTILYVLPGRNINIEFDCGELRKGNTSNVKVTGKGSDNTVFLYFINNKLNHLFNAELSKLPVDSFEVLMEKAELMRQEETEKFIKDNSPSEEFIEVASLIQKVYLASKYYDYIINQNRYSTDNKMQLPDSFQQYIEETLSMDYEKLKGISGYWQLANGYYNYKIRKNMESSGLKEETVAYINRMADEIIALNAPQEIKDAIGQWKFSVFYKRPDSLRQVYRARYSDVVKNPEYVEEFEKIAEAREKLKPGSVAPSFSYPDINGEMISLESFRGKVVYIDVWATWCGPCIAEIPYLKKLQNELKNKEIVFVSISIDSEKDKKAWEKMVEEKELGGYHLYAEGEWESKIAKDYVIRGIPYFIIIDKEGKLVEVFATRPSDPETKEKLLMLANR